MNQSKRGHPCHDLKTVIDHLPILSRRRDAVAKENHRVAIVNGEVRAEAGGGHERDELNEDDERADFHERRV